MHLLSPYPPPKIRKTLLSNNKSQHSLIFEQIPLKIRPKCMNKIIANKSISHIHQRSEHQRYVDHLFGNHYQGLLPPWISSLSDVINFGKIANKLLSSYSIKIVDWSKMTTHVAQVCNTCTSYNCSPFLVCGHYLFNVDQKKSYEHYE